MDFETLFPSLAASLTADRTREEDEAFWRSNRHRGEQGQTRRGAAQRAITGAAHAAARLDWN